MNYIDENDLAKFSILIKQYLQSKLPVETYAITTSVTNGTYSGSATITWTGTESVTISANTGYELPETITVIGASYTYDNTTGVISLYNATGNVTISAECPETNCITLSAPTAFTVESYYVSRGYSYALVDGSLYYSYDSKNWTLWDGTQLTSVQNSDDNNYYVYMRGYGNTRVGYNDHLHISGNHDIKIKGQFSSLLDYTQSWKNVSVTLSGAAFSILFRNCDLYDASELYIELPNCSPVEGMFYEMFNDCQYLVYPPKNISFGTPSAVNNIMRGMFIRCTSLIETPHIFGRINGPMSDSAITKGVNTMIMGSGSKQYLYNQMFSDCTSLKYVNFSLNIPNAGYSNMFNSMFRECENLEEMPALYVTGAAPSTLPRTVFQQMYANCTKIKISETQTGEYVNEYCINPFTGTISPGSGNNYAFSGTGGTYTGNFQSNTKYYTSNNVVTNPMYSQGAN